MLTLYFFLFKRGVHKTNWKNRSSVTKKLSSFTPAFPSTSGTTGECSIFPPPSLTRVFLLACLFSSFLFRFCVRSARFLSIAAAAVVISGDVPAPNSLTQRGRKDSRRWHRQEERARTKTRCYSLFSSAFLTKVSVKFRHADRLLFLFFPLFTHENRKRNGRKNLMSRCTLPREIQDVCFESEEILHKLFSTVYQLSGCSFLH